jgi:protein-tyrosine-phosphatase
MLEYEDFDYDLVVSLTPEAHHAALEFTRNHPVEVEYWPTEDPTLAEGNRDQRLDAYRAVRDQLMKRIRERFADGAGTVT